MGASEYDLELDKICRIVKTKRRKKIAIQLPEALKRYAQNIAQYIERTGVIVSIQGEPCYGACDLELRSSKKLAVNLGHAEIPYLRSEKIVFVECRAKHDIKEVVKKACEILDKNVGLATIAQYTHKLEEARNILEENGFNVFIGKGTRRLKYPAQVLGCNFSACSSIASKVDNYLYLGTGNFHPLGIALATNKKVVIADPELNKSSDIENLKIEILKQRWGAVEKAMSAEFFGIIIGRKQGQRRGKLALDIKKSLEKKSKKALLIELSNIEPQYLEGFNCDAFVCTACPRIAIDDFAMFSKPMLTPVELEILLGLRKWSDYEFDQID
ncbi:MAG: diphthamide biosynthesis enzyme Dph2 [Candidatus Thermoplasmatota archaeon]|nr:diphthamide biosynthesis enzyme Dph2 [Candidatus Thermoplasmatota archaeon]